MMFCDGWKVFSDACVDATRLVLTIVDQDNNETSGAVEEDSDHGGATLEQQPGGVCCGL